MEGGILGFLQFQKAAIEFWFFLSYIKRRITLVFNSLRVPSIDSLLRTSNAWLGLPGKGRVPPQFCPLEFHAACRCMILCVNTSGMHEPERSKIGSKFGTQFSTGPMDPIALLSIRW